MAVKHVETFTFELPLAAVDVPREDEDESVVEVTMGRVELASLYRDIGTALGAGRADDYGRHLELHQEFEEAIFTTPYPGTERLSVEEAAAQAQIAAQQAERQQHLANPNQPRGSAIGNQHV